MSAKQLTNTSSTRQQLARQTGPYARNPKKTQPELVVVREIEDNSAGYFWGTLPEHKRPVNIYDPERLLDFDPGCGHLTVEGFRTTCAETWKVDAGRVAIRGWVGDDEATGHLVAFRPKEEPVPATETPVIMVPRPEYGDFVCFWDETGDYATDDPEPWPIAPELEYAYGDCRRQLDRPDVPNIARFRAWAAEKWSLPPERFRIDGVVSPDGRTGHIFAVREPAEVIAHEPGRSAYWWTLDDRTSKPSDPFALPSGARKFDDFNSIDWVVDWIDDCAKRWDCHPSNVECRGVLFGAEDLEDTPANGHLVCTRKTSGAAIEAELAALAKYGTQVCHSVDGSSPHMEGKDLDAIPIGDPDQCDREEILSNCRRWPQVNFGTMVIDVRASQRASHLATVEADALILEMLDNLADEKECYSPEYFAAQIQVDRRMKELGYPGYSSVLDYTDDEYGVKPEHRDEAKALLETLWKAGDMYRARLLRQCGEDRLADLVASDRQAVDSLRDAGLKSIVSCGWSSERRLR